MIQSSICFYNDNCKLITLLPGPWKLQIVAITSLQLIPISFEFSYLMLDINFPVSMAYVHVFYPTNRDIGPGMVGVVYWILNVVEIVLYDHGPVTDLVKFLNNLVYG